MTLLILAAGMGSRFGGLKQMEPFGPNGEFIIDYSIYDAKRAGFNKVVFVIKEEMLDDFKKTVGKRIEGKIDVEYVFQKIDDIPVDMKFERVKPWGTGHAVLAARDVISENFVMINADDFYGRDAFERAYKFLSGASLNSFGLVGYKAVNTLTENGSVKRGVCEISDGKLVGIDECSIFRDGDLIHCNSLVTSNEYDVELERKVSMNMLLFTPQIFKYLKDDFNDFFKTLEDSAKGEFLIPDVLDKHIKSNDITVDVIDTDSVWYGVTYKEDKDSVQKAISNLISSGEYSSNLWGE